MAYQPTPVNVMSAGACPVCHAEVVVGITNFAAAVSYIVTPADIEAGKQKIVDAINASALPEESKKASIENMKGMTFSPTEVKMALEEIEKTYGIKG